MKVIIDIIRKEFIQFKRDRKMFVVVLFAPVIQLIILGYASTLDIKQARLVIFDQDKTQTSRNFIDRFEKSGYFQVVGYSDNYHGIDDMIDKGEALVAMVIPADFEKNLELKTTSSVQIIFDGSDGNKASIVFGYVQSIAQTFSANVITEIMEKSGLKNIKISKIEPEVRVWYNPQMTTRYYMLPGIVAMLVMIITINLTSLAIVKEREIGTLEQLIVTPIKPYQLIIGKMIPFSILGFVVVVLVLGVMRYWFGIEIQGSKIFLIFSTSIFMLSTLGLGLFVSTISKTQQQASMTSMFGVMLPMIYLSGFIFPIENMPAAIQYITYLLPLRYFIVIIRGVILKGIGFENLWSELLILFLFGVAILTISSLRFRKKLG